MNLQQIPTIFSKQAVDQVFFKYADTYLTGSKTKKAESAATPGIFSMQGAYKTRIRYAIIGLTARPAAHPESAVIPEVFSIQKAGGVFITETRYRPNCKPGSKR